ncbi:hypothetical protein LEMLEM_LOCUS10157 [Lemmus lemmus]
MWGGQRTTSGVNAFTLHSGDQTQVHPSHCFPEFCETLWRGKQTGGRGCGISPLWPVVQKHPWASDWKLKKMCSCGTELSTCGFLD